MKIDYENCLVNLGASVGKNFGLKMRHPSLKRVDEALSKGYKNVVLMVLDGLGIYNMGLLLPVQAFLPKYLGLVISSVFPSTTTAATVTLESGLTPIEHGWLGWTLDVPQEGKSVNLLINTDLQGQKAAAYHVGQKHMPFEPLYKKVNRVKGAQGHCVSPFGPNKENTLTKMERAIKTICNEEGRQYIYAYWPEPDGLMHEYGVQHPKAVQGMEKINGRLEKLAASLKDTLLIITADHGLIDGENVNLRHNKPFWAMLEKEPTLEPRCCNFHIKAGWEEAFERAFIKDYGQDFILYTKEQALNMGLFGWGEVHPQLQKSLGGYIAVATGKRSLFDNEEKCRRFVGIHAGFTKEEMEVPVIMISCGI